MIWKYLGGIWRHLGGIWDSLEALCETLLCSPGGSLGLQGHGRCLGAKMMQDHCVLLSKVARPTILAESGEGDPHDLRSLHTKVAGRRGRADPAQTPPSSKTIRQKPYSVNTAWGNIIK